MVVMKNNTSNDVELSALSFNYDSTSYENLAKYINEFVKFKRSLLGNDTEIKLADRMMSSEMKKRPEIRDTLIQLLLNQRPSFDEFKTIFSAFYHNGLAKDVISTKITLLES